MRPSTSDATGPSPRFERNPAMPHISHAAYGRPGARGYVTRAVIAASAMCAMHIARTITGMAEKIRWGVLGAANIAVEKVIPAMQRGAKTEVVAIASLRQERGRAAAAQLGIERVHDSYEALLADPGVDAVYNPLPNHLHVPWSIRAAEAGKHVLCEKPIGLTADEARSLLAVRDRTGVVIGEAFMARSHPQWLRARELRAVRRDRRPARRHRHVHVLQPRPAERPQHPRHRRWRPVRHRLLPDHARRG